MGRRVFVAAATLLLVGVFGTSGASAHTSSTFCKNGSLIGEVSGNVTVEGFCELGEAPGYRPGATITGNVFVKPGGELFVSSFEQEQAITIEGSITAMHGSVFLYTHEGGPVTVDGSVHATDPPNIVGVTGSLTHVHGSVSVSGGTGSFFMAPNYVAKESPVVDGNVRVTGMTGCPEFFRIEDAIIGGRLAIGKNHLEGCGRSVEAIGNSVGGDLRVFENVTTGSPPLEVGQNHVGHNLNVHANVASKIDVFENTVTNELICAGNSPAPEVVGNTAARTLGQQCKAL